MKLWRPPNWQDIKWDIMRMGKNMPTYKGGMLAPDTAFEAGADAMHQADIEWLKKHAISKPTDRFKVISIHEEEWQDFIREE